MLGRFKNKLKLKKLEWKRFYEHFWGPAQPIPASEAEYNDWIDSYHAAEGSSAPSRNLQVEFRGWADSHHSAEGSHVSDFDSKYLDPLSPEDYGSLVQPEPIGRLPLYQPGHQSPVPGMRPTVSPVFQHDLGMQSQGGEFQPMLAGNDFVDSTLVGSAVVDVSNASELNQIPSTPGMAHLNSFDSSSLSANGHFDADNDNIVEWQSPSSAQVGNQSLSPFCMDARSNMDMIDSGSSSTIPLKFEDRLQWFKQFFEIGAEDAVLAPHQANAGRGWGVMVRIIGACIRLTRLVRRKKLEKRPLVMIITFNLHACHYWISGAMLTLFSQRLQQGQSIIRKKIRGFGENRSQLYKGVRRRNGKWVSEIRIGQTNEKVWLGSYDTEKEAALAFDAGKYHCSAKRCRSFNFPDSPKYLGPLVNVRSLSKSDRRKAIQKLAEDHVKTCSSALC